MNKPHKHSKLIHAWAEGAVIQFFDITKATWEDVTYNSPYWTSSVEYRIKPEPKPDYSKFIGIFEHKRDSTCNHTDGVYSSLKSVPDEIEAWADSWYDLVSKLELIFDGETKELKDVKIHGKE